MKKYLLETCEKYNFVFIYQRENRKFFEIRQILLLTNQNWQKFNRILI